MATPAMAIWCVAPGVAATPAGHDALAAEALPSFGIRCRWSKRQATVTHLQDDLAGRKDGAALSTIGLLDYKIITYYIYKQQDTHKMS